MNIFPVWETNVGLPAKKSSVNANRTKQIKINIVFGPKASEQSVW